MNFPPNYSLFCRSRRVSCSLFRPAESGLATDGKSRFSGWPFNSTAVPDVKQVRTSALRPSYPCFCVSLVFIPHAWFRSNPPFPPRRPSTWGFLFNPLEKSSLIRRWPPPDPGGVRTGRTGGICWCHGSRCDIRVHVPLQMETWWGISFLFPREAAGKLRGVRVDEA